MASSLPNTVHHVNSLCTEQTLPIGRNTCSAIKSNILPIPTWQLLRDNILLLDLGRGHGDATLYLPMWTVWTVNNKSFKEQLALVSKKLTHLCFDFSWAEQSLKLSESLFPGHNPQSGLNKFSTSFRDWLINFSLIKMRMTRPYSRHMK